MGHVREEHDTLNVSLGNAIRCTYRGASKQLCLGPCRIMCSICWPELFLGDCWLVLDHQNVAAGWVSCLDM